MPPKAGKENITTAEIRALNETMVKTHDGQDVSLHIALDSAPQLLFLFEGMFPYSGAAKAKLSDIFELDGAKGEKTAKMMSNMFDYHSRNMPKIAGEDTNVGEISVETLGPKSRKLSRQNTYEFFSLAYHLLDQGDPMLDASREHIRAAFTVMGMGEPMSMEQLKGCRAHIADFTTPKQKQKGG